MVKMKEKKSGELTREKICQYVWAVYIDNTKAPFQIDEEDAIHFFEKYYSRKPLNQDEESFYYGVLLFEQAFSREENRARYLMKAKEVFECYRSLTGETEWDPIEDRYSETVDMIESESLASKVQTRSDLAPEIPGMVLVPAGPFPYGDENNQTHLEPFYIDVYPVTNKQYREFLEETKYRRPVIWEREPELAGDELPVTGVSWMDALQYCKWSGKRLPTAEQWEKAARGSEGRTYPWGEDTPTPEIANYRDNIREPELKAPTNFTTPSPFGVFSMVGGVWEWTNSAWPELDGTQIVKGGSWDDPPHPAFISATAALPASKKEKMNNLGFRCTKALEV